MDKITKFADYFQKIPAPFLVTIVTILGLVLFLPEQVAKTLAVHQFRENYRIFLGPTFLLAFGFLITRIFNFFRQKNIRGKILEERQLSLHKLTPTEKGYLVPYILNGENTIYVGLEDGIMGGLVGKRITYRASNAGNLVHGFAFNLNDWAREYLNDNPQLLEGSKGHPQTPSKKLLGPW